LEEALSIIHYKNQKEREILKLRAVSKYYTHTHTQALLRA